MTTTEHTTATAERAASRRRRTTLTLAALGSFLAALDIVIVATALPALRADFGASLADLEWTLNGYNLVFSVLMLTGAALGDRYGRRRMYVTGVLVFTVASAAAALSPDAASLVVARVVQGVGGALLMPLTMTLVGHEFPPRQRAAAFGVLGAVTGLGVASGPVLGGLVVEGLSWQWVFWVNVPVGLALAVLSARLLRESHGPRARLDVVGLVLAGAGMFALTWAPVRAPETGWGDPEVVGSLVAGAALAAAFVAWERRTAVPMLPLAYFRSRGFTTANAVGFLQQLSLIGTLFVVTQLFQFGLGYSPLDAGVRLLPWVGTLTVVAPVAGLLAGRFGSRPVLVAGLLLQTGGLGWLAAVTEPGVAYSALVVPMITTGVGTSLVIPVSTSAVTLAVPTADVGVASGVNRALVNLGAVFGVAVIAAVFAANGGYGSPAAFVAGFSAAVGAAAGVIALALVPALLGPSREAELAPHPDAGSDGAGVALAGVAAVGAGQRGEG
jgi:EmrB/QacA subfamily drug resistance transporter